MIERKIKELSIALEALSRINTSGTYVMFSQVEALLSEAIKEAGETNQNNKALYPTQPNLTDDTPF